MLGGPPIALLIEQRPRPASVSGDLLDHHCQTEDLETSAEHGQQDRPGLKGGHRPESLREHGQNGLVPHLGYRCRAVREGDAGIEEAQEPPRAEPGWYPDPRGSGNLFYWDGERWTGDVRGAPRPRPTTTKPEFEPARVTVICGGAALAISPFLTWVKVVLLGNLTLFQLFNATGRSSGWAWAALLAGGLVTGAGFNERRPFTLRGIGLSIGLAAGVIAIVTLERMLDDLRETQGLATVGIGPYVAVGGCLAIVIGSLMLKSREPGVRRATG